MKIIPKTRKTVKIKLNTQVKFTTRKSNCMPDAGCSQHPPPLAVKVLRPLVSSALDWKQSTL